MTRLRALTVSLAAVVLAVVAAWMPASADGELLTLEIDVSPRICTAGSLAVATWLISGGEGPYQLTIDGETVDADAESATVRCGSSLADAPAWLSEAARRAIVHAEVVDAAGASANAVAMFQPGPALPPPSSISANIWQNWGDHRQAVGVVYVKAVERAGGEPDAALPGSDLYTLRWREAGERRWNYETPVAGGEDSYRRRYSEAPPPGTTYASYRWELGRVRAGTFYEFQGSRLRSQIEQETPDALRWSPLLTTISAGPPRDVTAHATRDSVTVSWQSNLESTDWNVSLYTPPSDSYPYSYRGRFVDEKQVTNSASHTIRFVDLIPGREYTIYIHQASSIVQAEATFDVRTEGVASNAELAAYRPKITRAEAVDGVLYVEWLPPAIGSERGYLVTAREYGVRGDPLRDTTDAGVMRASLAGINPATTYRVAVEVNDGHGGRDERIIETPPDLPEHRAWDWPLAPHLRVEWVQTHGEYGGFRISWDPIEEDEAAQVQWERDGYLMSRIGPSPIMINVDQPGRYAFRTRLRLGDGWTSWSGRVHAETKPPQPRSVRIDERADALRVEWEAGWPFTPVDGYRIRYEPYTRPEQEFTIREGAEITIPIERSCEGYALWIVAFNDEFGEGPPRLRHVEAKGRCGWLSVSLDTVGAACDAEDNTSTVVRWTISQGVAPFKIVVRGHKPLHTDERRGWIRIYCQAEPTEGVHLIPIVVTDAVGDSYTAEIELPSTLAEDGSRKPHSIEIDDLRLISVSHNEIRISWWCESWADRWVIWHELARPNVLLRWRNAASPEWMYVKGIATPLVSKVNNGCHWTWAGLEPGAHYEFQLAAWIRPEELEAPEWLRWSPLQSVTTLSDPEDLRVSREQSAVVVTWKAQPHAWAYQVVLRGAEESWWKYYLPNGEDVERAVFRDIPPGGSYEVEIITPPRVAGEPATEPGFIVPIPPH